MSNVNIDNLTQLFSNMSLIKKFTLVLDLDETLVHSIATTDTEKINKLKNMNNLLLHYLTDQTNIFVFYRPHMLYFLKEMSHYFDICVFTNGIKSYADIIVTMINNITSHTYISRWYSRTGEYPFYKYISLIEKVNSSEVLIIDDNNDIWINDRENVIKINQFYGPEDENYTQDTELLYLAKTITRAIKSKQILNIYNLIEDVKLLRKNTCLN